jgi:hypothetical protein
MTTLVAVLNIAGPLVTALIGVLGITFEHKTKSGAVTRSGRVAVAAILLSSAIAFAAQKAKAHSDDQRWQSSRNLVGFSMVDCVGEIQLAFDSLKSQAVGVAKAYDQVIQQGEAPRVSPHRISEAILESHSKSLQVAANGLTNALTNFERTTEVFNGAVDSSIATQVADFRAAVVRDTSLLHAQLLLSSIEDVDTWKNWQRPDMFIAEEKQYDDLIDALERDTSAFAISETKGNDSITFSLQGSPHGSKKTIYKASSENYAIRSMLNAFAVIANSVAVKSDTVLHPLDKRNTSAKQRARRDGATL